MKVFLSVLAIALWAGITYIWLRKRDRAWEIEEVREQQVFTIQKTIPDNSIGVETVLPAPDSLGEIKQLGMQVSSLEQALAGDIGLPELEVTDIPVEPIETAPEEKGRKKKRRFASADPQMQIITKDTFKN